MVDFETEMIDTIAVLIDKYGETKITQEELLKARKSIRVIAYYDHENKTTTYKTEKVN